MAYMLFSFTLSNFTLLAVNCGHGRKDLIYKNTFCLKINTCQPLFVKREKTQMKTAKNRSDSKEKKTRRGAELRVSCKDLPFSSGEPSTGLVCAPDRQGPT